MKGRGVRSREVSGVQGTGPWLYGVFAASQQVVLPPAPLLFLVPPEAHPRPWSGKDDGELVVSQLLSAEARELLGLEGPLRVRAVAEGHRRYLPWHRERVFRRG